MENTKIFTTGLENMPPIYVNPGLTMNVESIIIIFIIIVYNDELKLNSPGYI